MPTLAEGMPALLAALLEAGIIELKAEGPTVSAHGGLRKSGTSSAAA